MRHPASAVMVSPQVTYCAPGVDEDTADAAPWSIGSSSSKWSVSVGEPAAALIAAKGERLARGGWERRDCGETPRCELVRVRTSATWQRRQGGEQGRGPRPGEWRRRRRVDWRKRADHTHLEMRQRTQEERAEEGDGGIK